MERLLIDCSSQEEADIVFDILEYNNEPVQRNCFGFTNNWNYIGFYINYECWTIANKDDKDDFENSHHIISFREFLHQEAKRRYPEGTKFKNAVNGDICTVRNHNPYKHVPDTINFYIEEEIEDCEGAAVYHKGKWAEIVEPMEDIYPEGTEVRIKEDSKYVHQATDKEGNRVKGIASRIDKSEYECTENDYLYYVEWQNGGSNSYRPIDLELWEEETPKDSDPLYICRQKYRKGMKVRSACKKGIYAGEFIITVNPEEFRITGRGVDYFQSEGWLYLNGEYAEILEYYTPISTDKSIKEKCLENGWKVGDRVKLISNNSYAEVLSGQTGIITEIHNSTCFSVNGHKGCDIKYWEKVDDEHLNTKIVEYKYESKPLIEPVQSISVNLRTKKNNNKLIF